MKLRLTKGMSLSAKRGLTGYCFIMPFIIGISVFFIFPVVQSLIYSFSRLQVTGDGFDVIWEGMKNYHRAFLIDPNFRRMLLNAIGEMITSVPLIVIFGFFAAVLLNRNFKGRAIARAVFFLPVILSTGVLVSIERSDIIMNAMKTITAAASEAKGLVISMERAPDFDLARFLLQLRLDPRLIQYLANAVSRLYDIVIASGVQILIFLAGLQTIPSTLYEASNMEGANGWDNFWKITFPMVSPLILVNTVYTIIDYFTNSDNAIIRTIYDAAFKHSDFGYSSAMAWSYFILIFIILGIVVAIISKFVFYREN